MRINYHNRSFRPNSLSSNSQLDEESIFHYRQEGNILLCQYNGGEIIKGHLIGIVDNSGCINMRYHQISIQGELQTGICHSTPKISVDGKITLYEKWQWTSGDRSKGESILIEI